MSEEPRAPARGRPRASTTVGEMVRARHVAIDAAKPRAIDLVRRKLEALAASAPVPPALPSPSDLAAIRIPNVPSLVELSGYLSAAKTLTDALAQDAIARGGRFAPPFQLPKACAKAIIAIADISDAIGDINTHLGAAVTNYVAQIKVKEQARARAANQAAEEQANREASRLRAVLAKESNRRADLQRAKELGVK